MANQFHRFRSRETMLTRVPRSAGRSLLAHRSLPARGTEFFIALLPVVLTLFVSLPSLAATRSVPAQFETIQGAIDASASGDTVLVAAGTYSGDGNRDLDFSGKDLVVMSESGPEFTIIECDGSEDEPHRGFSFSNGETRAAVVDGFTVRGGKAINGGGIHVGGVSAPTIRNCWIRENEAASWHWTWYGGAGIGVVDGAAPLIVECWITDNMQPDGGSGGAGVCCRNHSQAEIVSCVIEHNAAAADGGGILVDDYAQLTLRGCRIERNNGYSGGGIWCDGAGTHLYAEECTIIRNVAQYFGAVSVADGTLKNCTIAENNGLVESGGLLVFEGMAIFDRCLIWGNCGSGGSSLRVYHGSASLTCCLVDSTGIYVGTNGDLTFDGPQVYSPAQFCDPLGCPSSWFDQTPGGDYSLRSDSPALPEFSPCGQLIGALGLGCSAPSPVGACCLEDGACVLLASDDCLAEGGLFTEEGAGCFPDPCHSSVVETGTWGQIKARYWAK